MRKECLILITVVLLSAGAAQAAIGWAQDFTLNAMNQVDWLGGIGSAASVNKASYDQRQQFGNTFANFGAFQRNTGTIFQNASASGPIGPSTSRQNADLTGGQTLTTNGNSFPEARGQQTFTGTFTNFVTKPDGVGQVDGIQHFVGGQEQGASMSFGGGTQSQFAEVLQRASISTGSDTDPTATGTVNLQMNQSQITSGW